MHRHPNNYYYQAWDYRYRSSGRTNHKQIDKRHMTTHGLPTTLIDVLRTVSVYTIRSSRRLFHFSHSDHPQSSNPSTLKSLIFQSSEIQFI